MCHAPDLLKTVSSAKLPHHQFANDAFKKFTILADKSVVLIRMLVKGSFEGTVL